MKASAPRLAALPANNGEPISASRIRYKKFTEGASAWIERELTPQEFAANATGGEVVIDMLENGERYECQWQVENVVGVGGWSPSSEVIPAGVPDAVGAPGI